jgi:hypothetical protein
MGLEKTSETSIQERVKFVRDCAGEIAVACDEPDTMNNVGLLTDEELEILGRILNKMSP